MAYNYTKLSDVTLVDSVVKPNILVEDGGEIKRIPSSNIVTSGSPTQQVRADWAEEDETSLAFILNKPDLSNVGGGANVVTYSLASGMLFTNGSQATRQSIIDEWNNGSILKINETTSTTQGSMPCTDISSGEICDIYYRTYSGGLLSATIHYYSNGTIKSLAV